jgi:hypothetical protein
VWAFVSNLLKKPDLLRAGLESLIRGRMPRRAWKPQPRS